MERSGQGNPAPVVLHDSFLVRDGRAQDIDGHVVRLAASAEVPPAMLLPGYRSLLRAAVAAPGPTFPLLTFSNGQLSHELRPFDLDALRTTARLWTPPEPDPRVLPRHKGPDFPLQTELRRRAVEHGADEAALVGEDGILREGAFSSVVHWADGCLVVSGDERRLPSVTEAAVVTLVQRRGVPVVRQRCRPVEVRRAEEVWTLSSLHGIRVVTCWDGEPVASAGYAESYRKLLLEREVDVSTWLDSSSTRVREALGDQLGSRGEA